MKYSDLSSKRKKKKKKKGESFWDLKIGITLLCEEKDK